MQLRFLLPLLLASGAPAQSFLPLFEASIKDTPRDGLGDGFNATPFEGLVRQTAALEDRAVEEFDVSALSGAILQSATLSGNVYVNNAFDVGLRTFDFSLYAGNGVADVSDFEIASILVGTGAYHPPGQTTFPYSFDVTAALQQLLNGGATFAGLKLDSSSEPNFPNILDFATSRLDVVVGTCGATIGYCTAGTTTNGCNATISGAGTPDADAGSGFVLGVAGVEGQKQGLLFYGLSNAGFSPLPWGPSSSFLCVKPPTQRTPPSSSGGTTGQCDGLLSIDWNAYIAANPGALGVPFSGGEHVFAQAWFRDPPSPKTTHLSDALEFLVCP
jgi:hypothetical protein